MIRKVTGKQQKPRAIRVNNRDVLTVGLGGGSWSDIQHRALTVSWPTFFAAAATIFLVFNLLFASLFWLGNKPISNVEEGSFLGLFYFSIETLATVGYGDMHPQTHYAHVIATIEIFTGMSLMAVMTGLVFTRFTRPRARFIFTTNPVICRHDGAKTLMVRFANARHNAISGATAKLWLMRNETSAEGYTLRRFHELKLHRQENPVFALSWTLFHEIDTHSPLAGSNAADLADVDAALVVGVTGLDDSTSQTLNARQIYPHTDIRWNHRYVDILVEDEEGRLVLDYRRLNDMVPQTP